MLRRLDVVRSTLAVLVVSTLAFGAGCAQSTDTQAGTPASSTTRVRVAAAADLKFALEGIKTEFGKQYPDIELALTFGSSGTFFQQLGQGAPFDVFLSADLEFPKKLVEQGKARKSDVFRYAVGRLVVWASTDSEIDATKGLSSLTDSAARKIAIANPEHAPYGRAAVAAMKSAGVYDSVKGKLVLGENVAQAAEFVQSGNADVAVVALSLALSPRFQKSGRYSEVPLDSYPRIDQGGVVMGAADDPAAARRLKTFMTSSRGRAILHDNGFFLPKR